MRQAYIGEHDHGVGVFYKSCYERMVHDVLRDVQAQRQLQDRKAGLRSNVVLSSGHVLVNGADITISVSTPCLDYQRVKE